MLTLHKCPDTGFYRHLSNRAFCILKFQKEISSPLLSSIFCNDFTVNLFTENKEKLLLFQKQIMSEAYLFFKVFEILYRFGIYRKNSENTFRFGIIAFEVVALNTGFYLERIIVIGCQ